MDYVNEILNFSKALASEVPLLLIFQQRNQKQKRKKAFSPVADRKESLF
jgi:hypothetical protein